MATPTETTTTEQSSNRGWWISGALILVLVALTAIFVDVKEMIQVIRNTDPLRVIAGILFLLLGIAIIDFRWWYLLSRRSTFRRVIHATHVSFIVPILTPIPNYISRVFITSTATDISLPQSTTAMVVERMIAQIMRITTIILTIALGVQSELTPASMARSIGFSILVLAAYLLAIQYSRQVTHAVRVLLTKLKLREAWVEKITAMVGDALCTNIRMKELLMALGMTIVMWTLFFFFHFLVILAMPLDMAVEDKFLVALGTLALTPPSAPAMLGIYQLSQIGPGLLLQLGAFEELLPYSLVLYFLQLLVWLTLTLFGLRALDMRFIDLFRLRNVTLVSDQAVEDEAASRCDD
jgi:uncharacterized membrane protein YbhN (UPF0104 family)